jgi:hypothetical protein
MKIGISNPAAQVVKTLLATILGSDGAQTKTIGYLPKSASVINRRAIVNSAFDSTLDVGIVNVDGQNVEVSGTDDPDALIDNTDITEGTAGTYGVAGTVNCSSTYGTKVTATTGSATAGEIVVRIDYVENEY